MRYFQTPCDMLKKADYEYRAFNERCLENDIDAAAYSLMNCTTALWHYVVDWVPHANGIVDSRDQKLRYIKEICKRCPALLICRDICTGYKHVEATRYKPATTSVQHRQFDLSPSIRIVSSVVDDGNAFEIEPSVATRFYVSGTDRTVSRFSVRDALYNALEFLERFELKRNEFGNDIMHAVIETSVCENFDRYSFLK